MRTWAVLAMVIALAPVAVWVSTLLKERRERQVLTAAPRIVDESALATSSSVSGTTTGGN
jgi:hypothetical protein